MHIFFINDFYMFRTSHVHHQDYYLYMQPYMLRFSCVYAGSLEDIQII